MEAPEKFPQGYSPIENGVDEVILQLYSHFGITNQEFQNLFFGFKFMEFDKKIIEFFTAHPKDWEAHNDFFRKLTGIWIPMRTQGLHYYGQLFWQRILQSVTWAEEESGQRAHKGSLFYYWGENAILNGEIDKGFFLIHKSFLEDLETHRDSTQDDSIPNTPAYKTVTFNFESDEQFMYPHVKQWSETLNRILDEYKIANPASKLILSDFRARFLLVYPEIDLLFLFTHLIARLHFLKMLPDYLKRSNFAGLYFLSLFFDILMVINDAIYFRIPKTGKFIHFKDLGVELLLASGHANDKVICDEDIRIVNDQNVSFNQMITDLIDQSYSFNSGTKYDHFVYDVALAYRIRNHSAHNCSSAPIISERFQDIMNRLFNVLFLTVETYY